MRPTLTTVRGAVRAATPALALATAALTAGLAACSDSPTSPTGSAGATNAPAFSKTADQRAAKAAKDSAKAVKHSAKDQESHLSDAALDSAAATWHTTAQDQESGSDQPVPLTCTGQGRSIVTQRVDKHGGVLHLGRNALTIPAGALAHAEQITATATVGAEGVQLDFAPHGLQFAKAVELRIDYAGCDAAATVPVNVFYTNATGGIAQVLPAAQVPGQQVVRALTDHFSGYLVSSGRHQAGTR